MGRITKKLAVVTLTMSVLFSYLGTTAYAGTLKDKKQEYYQEYQKIIKEANKKVGDDEFALLPMSEIDEKNMLTPEEFQKVVDATIQLETQAPMEDNDPDEYSDESVDQLSGRASGETVTESQTRKVAVSKNQYIRLKCTATFVTRYNSSKKRRFITEIKSAKVTVTGLGFTWKKSPTMTKKIIDGGRTGEISCLGVLKNSSGFTKQVSEIFEFYCNSAGGIEIR